MAACSSPTQFINCPICAIRYPVPFRDAGSPKKELYQICEICFSGLSGEHHPSPLNERRITQTSSNDARAELIFRANQNARSFLVSGWNELSTLEMEVLWSTNQALCLNVLEETYKKIEIIMNSLPILLEDIDWRLMRYDELKKLLKTGGSLEAADHGNRYAQYCLATCYATGLMLGISDWREALRYYNLGIKNGVPLAMSDLGSQLLRGDKIQRNSELGIRCLQQAAERDCPKGIYLLGKCYLEGMGVNKDVTEAFNHFKSAAEKGFSLAYYDVSICYAEGIGTPKQFKLAKEYYQKAIESEDLRARELEKLLEEKEKEDKVCLLL